MEEEHEVESALLGPVLEQVGDDPLGFHSTRLRETPSLLEGDRREVDADYLPPSLSEPDGVAAFAKGEV